VPETHERAGGHEGQDHSDVYTVANVITILRLLMIPFAFSALISGAEDSNVLAFVLFSVAAGTDWVDGQIARRTGTVTSVGKVIDPLVDRLLIAAGVLGLYMIDRIPLWIVILLLARDVYLLYGSWILEHYRRRIPVTLSGKATTFILLAGFSLLILGWPEVTISSLGTRYLGTYLVYVGIVLSLTAAVQYTFLAKKARDEARAAGIEPR
jgi:cardiolipin synthase